MKLTVILSERALKDTKSVYDWYEERVTGLGERFYKKLAVTYRRLEKNPRLGKLLKRNVQVLPIPTFPYTIFYMIEGDRIHIIRVIHQARHPGAWKKKNQ